MQNGFIYNKSKLFFLNYLNLYTKSFKHSESGITQYSSSYATIQCIMRLTVLQIMCSYNYTLTTQKKII